MKQQIQITVCACMGNPVICFQLLDDVPKELSENVKGLSFVKQFALIYFLNVEVLVDWNLNYEVKY